jgi:hypothetical protein
MPFGELLVDNGRFKTANLFFYKMALCDIGKRRERHLFVKFDIRITFRQRGSE